jgi:hypothetical protein
MEQITLFKHYSQAPAGTMSLQDLCICIRRGFIRINDAEIDFTSTIANLRTEADKDKRTAIKKQLPAVIVSGEFTKRDVNALVKSSRLMVIDIDGDAQKKGWDLQGTMDAMKNYGNYFRLVCLSPSGNGIKIIVEHLHDAEQHDQVFKAIASEIEQTFDVVVDQSGKDLIRLMFLTKDVDAWMDTNYPAMTRKNMAYRNEAIMYAAQTEEPPKKSAKKTTNNPPKASAKNESTFKAICDAVSQGGIDITNRYEDWIKIAFGIACEFGENGRDGFHTISQQYAGYEASECDAQYDDALKNHSGQVKFASVIHIAKEHGIDIHKPSKTNDRTEKTKDSFWHWKGERIRIDEVDLYRFFKANGVALIRIGAKHSDDKPAPCTLVEITDNIVKRINAEHLRNLVKSYLDSIDIDDDTLHEIRNAVSKGASTLFSEDKWSLHFDIIENPQFMRETFDIGYMFFKSTYIEITKDSRVAKPYRTAKHYVWSEWRIQKDCGVMHPEDYQASDFHRFLQTVCTPSEDAPLDVARFDALRWSIGCLMHNPKTTARKVLIHFCEDNAHMHMSSNGRTGKDLISYEAIKRIRKVDKVSYTRGVARGKTSFPLQEVSASTQVIHYGDVDKDYLKTKFVEDVFDNVTGGLSPERKREHPIRIPAEDAPRLASTGNAVPLVQDESSKGRFHLMEIYSRFNASFTPEDMFGRRFFEEQWNGNDWSAFFNTMMECIQYHIANPERPSYDSDTLALNQFRTNTHPEWHSYIMRRITDMLYSEGDTLEYIHNEFKQYRKYEHDKLIFAEQSGQVFDSFRKHCRNDGIMCDGIRHQDVNRWMDLTIGMLDAHFENYIHTYVHKKLSSEGGAAFHLIFRVPKNASKIVS